MEIGFIGLGKMGGNMALRLALGSPDGSVVGGHSVVGYAKEPNLDLQGVAGVRVVDSIEALVRELRPPRVVWVMVPAGDPTESVISTLSELVRDGDVIVDGGNSHFKDSIRRANALSHRDIGFLDCGTSGGVWGRAEGYCLMVGGRHEHVDRCRPIFDTLAPPEGWAHVGPSGAGHFVKMVHNGIEYGIMEAYAEGFEVMHKAKFEQKLDLHKIAVLWNHGSVIRSWLLELAEKMLEGEPELKTISPYVEDSGEGRWTIHTAMEEDVPVPVIAAALFARFESRDPFNFSARFTAGLRKAFGGHAVKKAEKKKFRE